MTVGTVTNDSFAEGYEEWGAVSFGASDVPPSASSTRLVSKVFDRFQLVMLPFAAAAAIAAPSGWETRTLSARSIGSYTRRMDIGWWLDAWAYTTETASLADVAELNRLLALPAVEGLVLKYPDD